MCLLQQFDIWIVSKSMLLVRVAAHIRAMMKLTCVKIMLVIYIAWRSLKDG